MSDRFNLEPNAVLELLSHERGLKHYRTKQAELTLGYSGHIHWWGNAMYVDSIQGNWSEGLTAYLADYQRSAGQGCAIGCFNT